MLHGSVMGYERALITGASSGLGRGVALALARRGTEVWVAARREDMLRSLCDEIATAGGRAHAVVLDVGRADETAARVAALDAEIGGLDLVLANAGIGPPIRAQSMTWERVRPTFEVNVMGCIATLTGVLPAMLARGRGHVAAVSSVGGFRGLPTAAAYCATKAAVSTFLEGIRIDLRGTPIAVTDVRPGFVKTPMTEQSKTPMPWLMDLDDGVAAIVRGLDRKQAVVAFPWQLVSLASVGRLVPSAVFDPIVGRASTPRPRR